MATSTTLAYDCGQGNGKLRGPEGWTLLESYAARRDRHAVTADLDGIKSQRARMSIELDNGQGFFVGRNAHAVGEPVEALDFERYTGAPEQQALFYGILTEYMTQHGVTLDRVRLTIGVPLQVLSGAHAPQTIAAIEGWLSGAHHWTANGQPYSVTIERVDVKSQAAGALYFFMYDEQGHVIRERKGALVAAGAGGVQFVPVGILSFGFLTMEAMGVQYQRDGQGQLELVKQDRFTASLPVGIHRLLDVARPGPHFTLAELDQQYRDGGLDVSNAMRIYQRDVSNALIETWGRDGWKRFGVILIVGGGAVQLGQWLLDRFEGKAFLPQSPESSNGHYRDGRGHDLMPILAIAEGLYRHAIRG